MSPRQRTTIAAAVVVLVVAVAAGLTLGRDSGSEGGARTEAGRAAPSTSVVDPEQRRAAAAGDALAALERAVAETDRGAFTDVYGGRRGLALFETLTALPMKEWALRFIVEESSRPGAWTGGVEARWSLRGFDDRMISTEVEVTFAPLGRGGATTVQAVRPDPGARTPEWLLGASDVRRAGTAMVISARPGLTDRVATQARRAVRDVRQVVGSATDPVVVVVPAGTAQLERMLGGPAGSYRTIAAVTTTVDGAADAVAPVRVVVNPPVYGDLGQAGAQVVLSHEVTHALTDAATTGVPLWLVEGFADYVALASEPVPLDIAASQILEQVRRDGVPEQLPSADDFDSEANQLGASYEAAWLACRMIAEREGERSLVRFYERALETGDVEAAMREELGTSTEQLTGDWRDYLEMLA